MTIRKQTSTTEIPPRHDTPEDQEIRFRAYELYEQRGRENGHDLDDWLEAEAELNTRQRKGIKSSNRKASAAPERAAFSYAAYPRDLVSAIAKNPVANIVGPRIALDRSRQ